MDCFAAVQPVVSLGSTTVKVESLGFATCGVLAVIPRHSQGPSISGQFSAGTIEETLGCM